jgi:carbonic anhydrase/acetyltransferase-like protein (isoleucine patch superfamily)
MTTFAVTDPAHTIAAINYALSNLGTGNVTGNTTIPGNVLVGNTTTGVVSQYGNARVFGYLYQWVNLRYSNNSTGGSGSFSTVPTNANYYGVFNSVSSAPSNNPTDYQWYEVAGGFGTSNYLFYSAIGGRQIQWAAANTAPSSVYVQSVANVAINLDIVTTANGTPGSRGPVVMAAVITTADPNTATSSTLTAWFSAARDAITPPIGTGLTPVTGDTASFTYAAGVGAPQASYNYNGSIWVPVTGQVISGNVIVRGTIAGNAIIANTITATQIAADTITATQIAANTITANNIATGTITATQIAANTITGNNIAAGTITTNNFTANTIQGNIIAAGTITAEQLAANAITANTVVSSGAVLGNDASVGFWLDGTTGNARFGNNLSIGTSVTIGTVISGGTLTANTVGSTQIVNGSITTDKFTANTINGNIISAGTITADQLSANALTANTVVSTGATLGSNTSSGFWLQGSTGNARFGNSVSIGNLLTVGSNASIGGNLIVGANANIGTNLKIGSGANIGTNLIVGNNASIGGNLTVAGLITSSNLVANSVATTTVVPAAITTASAVQMGNVLIRNNAVQNIIYTYPGPTQTTIDTFQPVILWSSAGLRFQVTMSGLGSSSTGYFYLLLGRYPLGSPASFTTIYSIKTGYSFATGTSSFLLGCAALPTFINTPATAGTYVYAWGAYYTVTVQTGTMSAQTFTLTEETTVAGVNAVNNIVSLGTKR